MKNIKDILSAYEVEPSAGCWDKLSQRLDAAAAQASAGTSSSSAAGTSAGKGAALLHSVGAKIATAVVGALITGGMVAFAILLPKNADIAENEPISTPVIQAVSDTLAETSAPIAVVVETKSKLVANTQTEPAIPVDETPTTIAPTISSSENEKPAPGQKTATVTAMPIQPAVTPHTIQPALSSHNTLNQIPLPNTSIYSQNMQDDPVLQNMPEDAIDWTPPTKVEIPNVFTPNGDGINDQFVIKGIENCEKRQLEVRNQTGNIVFQSSHYENEWSGDNCPDGTYRFQLIYSSHNISQTLTGTVTIIRK